MTNLMNGMKSREGIIAKGAVVLGGLLVAAVVKTMLTKKNKPMETAVCEDDQDQEVELDIQPTEE